MSNMLKVLMIIVVSTLLVSAFQSPGVVNAQISGTEHVYYGYVPPLSTDIANTPTASPYMASSAPSNGNPGFVDELTRGTKINYTVPSGVAVLDVVGLEDHTSIQIWDIYANQMVNSTTVDKLHKKFFYIPFGTFFKLVSSNRVATFLSGGSLVNDYTDYGGGTSTFYPAVTGGFRGKSFIFNAAPGTHPYEYSMDVVGYDFYLLALEKTDWTLSDSINVWSTSSSSDQRGTKTIMLQSRTRHPYGINGYNNGVGDDVVFQLIAGNDTEVCSCASAGDFVTVPAITGGYVGKLFYAPAAATWSSTGYGHAAFFLVVPLEQGTVTVYDKGLNVIASKTFSATDVQNKNYWFDSLGLGRFDLIAESTGNIVFMVGDTDPGPATDVTSIGDDITFIGSRIGQEIRFYAPTSAVIFAPENLTMVSIDGEASIQMLKDSFRLLGSGAHSVSADGHVIVEVLAGGYGWNSWGSYLIEPLDADVSYAVPQGFSTKGVDYTMYIAISAVAVAVVVAVVFMLRRRGAGRA